jgi:undecaprenyl-diphosphatase
MIPLAWRRHRKEVVAFVIIFIMGVLTNALLKGIIHRSRPAISPLIGAFGYGFPLGHAMNSFVFYPALAFFFCGLTRRKMLSLLVVLLSVSIVILVGLSRMYLGEHYPSDVVAGYVVGAWWLATAVLVGRSAALAEVLEAGSGGG